MEEENKNLTTPEPTEPTPETPEAPEVPEVPEPEPTEPEPAEPAPEEPVAPITPEPITPEPAPEPPKKKPKTLIIVLAVILVLLLGATAFLLFFNPLNKTAQNSQEPSEPVQLEASKLRLAGNSLSDFDLAFLRLEEGEKNKIYSPLSIKYALAMLEDGSAGTTKAQIENLIGDYKPKAYLNSENRSLANAMFIRSDFDKTILDSYKETLAEKYYADVKIDAFKSASPFNDWVSDKTLGIIDNMFDDDITDFDFVLINALAIDMNWKNQLQCGGNMDLDEDAKIPCKDYSVNYRHEKYSESILPVDNPNNFDKISFNGKEGASSAEIGASINRYDIIKGLGKDYIRETATADYRRFLEEQLADLKKSLAETTDPEWRDETYPRFIKETEDSIADIDAYIDRYMEELASNYGQTAESTDFSFSDSETERVFVKDLKEYDGSTLQYVGIMPKTDSLEKYFTNLTAAKASELISNVKDTSTENFKDGVVTKITGHIPFFKFDYKLDLMKDLKTLGVVDVFEQSKADLSNMTTAEGEYIEYAAHKADIEFSNDGIKAAAVTAFGGKGAGAPWDYEWDVPVEEIDLTFDKPFLFLIRDKSTDEIWFTGTVYEI